MFDTSCVSSTVSEVGGSLLAIEEGGSFFECAIPGLKDEQVAVDELEKDPNNVDNVVLPPNGSEGDRVNVLVEDEGEGDDEVENVETLGTNRVGQDFDGVGDDERGEGNIVETVVEEDESNDCVAGGFVLVEGVLGGANGLEQEHDEHASGRGQEKLSTTETFAHEGSGYCDEQIPDLETTIDTELGEWVGDTDGVENFGKVVRNETVAGPLREEGEGNDDPHAAEVTTGGEEGFVANVGGDGTIKLDSSLDFLEFVSNEGVSIVTTSVPESEDLPSFLLLALGDQPTRRFGDEPDKDNLGNGGESLESGRNTPCPGVLNLESAKGGPCGDNGTGVPERVVERGQLGTLGWIGEFGNEERGSVGSEGETEPDEETSTNEHSDGLGSGLNASRGNHDTCTEEDGGAATETIREIRCEWVGSEGTNVLDGVEQTELSALGVVKVARPLGEGLETVHHGTIVSVGGRGDEKEEDAAIKPDQPGVLPPGAGMKEMLVLDVSLGVSNSAASHVSSLSESEGGR